MSQPSAKTDMKRLKLILILNISLNIFSIIFISIILTNPNLLGTFGYPIFTIIILTLHLTATILILKSIFLNKWCFKNSTLWGFLSLFLLGFIGIYIFTGIGITKVKNEPIDHNENRYSQEHYSEYKTEFINPYKKPDTSDQ